MKTISEPSSSTPSRLPTITRRRLSELFTQQEIAKLTARSDLRGWWAVLSTWAVIAICFAVLAIWPNPFTFVLGVIVLGGRQLALAILAHEAAHRSLF
jgi:fatty acid desaturase